MIKRINLIEAQPFSFTYLKLIKICLAVISVLILATGYQYFKVYHLNKQIAFETTELNRLKKDSDKLMAQPVKEKINIGQYQEILDKLESAPQWSKILNDISLRLPNSVWITAFKSLDSVPFVPVSTKPVKGGGKAAAEEHKEAEKPGEIVQKLEFSGMSNDVRNLSEFMGSMTHSTYFRNLILSESKQQGSQYTFVINSEARTDVK